MYKILTFLLIFFFLIESCSVKKEKVKTISKDVCDNIAYKIKNIKIDKNKYEISGIIKGKGFLYAIFKGYINSKSKISLYTPFGKKLYSIETVNNNIFCIKTPKDLICVDKKDFYKTFLKVNIPFSLKELILGKYKIKNIDRYICENGKIILEGSNKKYIYSLNGKILQLNFDKFLIKYKWDNSKNYPSLIKIYENGKYKLKLKIKNLKKVNYEIHKNMWNYPT